MPVVFKVEKASPEQKVPVWSWTKDVPEDALSQAVDVASLPGVFHHVALMPDVHVGFGMPIGGVAGLVKGISPSMVGNDIGCGVHLVDLGIKIDDVNPDKWETILFLIKQRIPLGFAHRKSTSELDKLGITLRHADFLKVLSKYDSRTEVVKQIATLGGGNHFIEFDRDDDGNLYLLIHSGSRNIGLKVANHFHKLGVKKASSWGFKLPNSALAVLPTNSSEGRAYIEAMNAALKFARVNRFSMAKVVLDVLRMVELPVKVSDEDHTDVHHNYAVEETHFGQKIWVHRKGAVRAWKGDKVVIPGSMGTASYVGVGLGNPDSFKSCSHGAGRKMSRREAKRRLSRSDVEKAMEGIVYDFPSSALDEAPQAYKDIDEVIEEELDLIEPKRKLYPVAVIKG